MDECDQSMDAWPRLPVNQLHSILAETLQLGTYVVHQDADVMETLSVTFETPGYARRRIDGCDQLQLCVAQGQEGNLYLLVLDRDALSGNDSEQTAITLERFVYILHGDCSVINAKRT